MGPETHRSWRLAAKATAITAGAVASIVGCGSSTPSFDPAAEPTESPATQERPAGEVEYVGEGAEGMAFDEAASLVALGVREPYRLAFVDPQGLFIKRQFPIPNPVRHLTVSPESSLVAVPAESANLVFKISPTDGVVAEVPTGEHPHDAAFADGKIFIADEFSDTVSVIKGGVEVESLPAPVQPGGIAAVEDRFVAAVAVSERVLQVYNARTNEPLGMAPAGVGPTHIESLGHQAFVADTEGNSIRRFDIKADPVEVEVAPAAGSPYGIAVDVKRKRVWVSLTATNQLAGYSFSGSKMRRFATYPTVQQPNSVTVNPDNGDVFVASRMTGQLERISPRGDGAR